MFDNCIFCRILKGETEATFVYQDDRVVAFADLFPLEEGHLLVVPKAHVENIYGLEEDIAGHLFRVTSRIAKAMKTVMKPDGITILQANERAGGQEVFHFHLHILPRKLFRRVFKINVTRTQSPRHDLERIFAPLRQALTLTPGRTRILS